VRGESVTRASRGPLLVAAGLALLAAIVFLPSAFSALHADDWVLRRTVSSFESLSWAFTRNDLGQTNDSGHFYRPVWVLYNVGIFKVFGFEPAAYHVLNVILYAATTVGVWALIRALLGSGAALIGAVAFAVYPRHGESVSWISGNTDVLATALLLPAVLVLLTRWPLWVRLSLAFVLGGFAALSKESIYAMPALAAIIVWAARDDPARAGIRRYLTGGREAVLVAVVTLAAVLPIFFARQSVIGTAGGYEDVPDGAGRIVTALGSQLVAALTPPQFEVLRHRWLLVVPVVVVVLLVWQLIALVRRGEHRRVRVALAGLAWFVLSLAPAARLAVDLNTSNGERFLYLGSVGLAVSFAALVGPELRSWRRPVAGAFVLAGLALSLWSASNWIAAGKMAQRLVDETAELAEGANQVVLLSVPENLRTAHVHLGFSLRFAVEDDHRPDLQVNICAPVHVTSVEDDAVSFVQTEAGFEGVAVGGSSFDFPVRRTPDARAFCNYQRPDGAVSRWGTENEVLVQPSQAAPVVALVYFDGRKLVRCCG